MNTTANKTIEATVDATVAATSIETVRKINKELAHTVATDLVESAHVVKETTMSHKEEVDQAINEVFDTLIDSAFVVQAAKKEDKNMGYKNVQEMVMGLVSEGMGLEEALNQAVGAFAPKKRAVAPEDRTEYISTINELQALADAIKCAFGKKSKAVTKFSEFADFTEDMHSIEANKAKVMGHYREMTAEDFDRIVRYEREIKAGQAHYNTIVSGIRDNKDPIAEAMKYNMAPSGMIQLILESNEDILEKELAVLKARTKATNAMIKKLLQDQHATIEGALATYMGKQPMSIQIAFAARIKTGDQRVIKFVKMYKLLRK